MDVVHQKMEKSDLLVFSSPVYCGTPPAKLIAFFERNIDRKKVSTDHVVPDIEMHQVLFKRLCI
jgi:hypothetical protein